MFSLAAVHAENLFQTLGLNRFLFLSVAGQTLVENMLKCSMSYGVEVGDHLKDTLKLFFLTVLVALAIQKQFLNQKLDVKRTYARVSEGILVP